MGNIDKKIYHKKIFLNFIGKQGVNISEKGSNVKFNNYHKQLQAPFVVFVDFESNLKVVQKPHRYNADSSNSNSYEEYIACGYGNKAVCIDDTFVKSVKTYQGENVVYSLIRNMFDEDKYCKEIMKKLFEQELVMSKENE